MTALKLNNVNLYAKYHENPEKTALIKKRTYMTVPIIFIILTLVGVSFWLYTIVDFLKNQLDMYIAEVESMSDEYREKSDIDYRTHMFMTENNVLSTVNSSADSYPELSDTFFTTVMDTVDSYGGEMHIYDMSYNSETGIFQMNMGSEDVTLVPEMTRKLLATGLFMDVTHVGYNIQEGSTDDDGNVIPDEYTFVVYAVMNIGETE